MIASIRVAIGFVHPSAQLREAHPAPPARLFSTHFQDSASAASFLTFLIQKTTFWRSLGRKRHVDLLSAMRICLRDTVQIQHSTTARLRCGLSVG